jgi:hypothetical protein
LKIIGPFPFSPFFLLFPSFSKIHTNRHKKFAIKIDRKCTEKQQTRTCGRAVIKKKNYFLLILVSENELAESATTSGSSRLE